ncbi:MAG: alpha,alpha-trehalase TreA [Chitinophagaceae bacterium]|nr:alpha,alpha-trehalase TreA [Chitinophagaceae bacterium]
MIRSFLIFFSFFTVSVLFAQDVLPPDKIYGELFHDVQSSRIFKDSKTFADAIPKKDPKEIVKRYLEIKANPAIRFSLQLFVEENFIIPKEHTAPSISKEKEVIKHIENLWPILTREPDKEIEGSSLLPLPDKYIVPGGRFREIYYWDSYFTMLGLKESGKTEMITSMINNFAYLLSTYGHIPNGNRSYYLSRSQPPFLSSMIELLADIKGDYIYATYLPLLLKEYDYWMDRTDPTQHIIKMPDGSLLNRYYDQAATPRQESYIEDIQIAEKSNQPKETIYRNLRSAAESGWDFSSRWFVNGKNLHTIQTTQIVPVDLNSLLYHLERTLAFANKVSGNIIQQRYYNQLAERRRKAINKYLWSAEKNWYLDYDLTTQKVSPELTLAGMAPFFFSLAEQSKISKAKITLEKDFIKPGGVVTSLRNSGEQWDAPNGWAPLQWITIVGLENYGESAMAKSIAERWVTLNKNVYNETGKLMEKYNVVDLSVKAGGGEYPNQDGFGWTNGVLLALIKKYDFKN